MLKSELDILNIVAENPETSQRNIAIQTEVSLGQVNFLLKRFVKKGFITMEGQTPASLSYNITQKGMAEKAEKTLRYIKTSYMEVQAQVMRIALLCQEYKSQGLHVHIIGSSDEMMEICKLACHRTATLFNVGFPPAHDNAVVFCWEEEVEKQCTEFRCVNLLKV